MTYLKPNTNYLQLTLENVNKDKFEQYKLLTVDERLWYADELFNYKTIIEQIINDGYYKYNEFIEQIRTINDELFRNKVPLLNDYFVFKYYKECKNASKIKHKVE
jgi:hypothetical protein